MTVLATFRISATGRKSKPGSVCVIETPRGNIQIDTEYSKPILSVVEARDLARHLYRMVRRVRMRSLPEEES